MSEGWPSVARLVSALGIATLLGLQPSSVNAQGLREAPVSSPTAASGYSVEYSPARPFFVEFRARNAESYGHLYVMYGEANDRHEIVRSKIAGFFPAGDTQHCSECSVYWWTAGHVLPVPSEIGASDGDLEEQYVLARFRIWIDRQQYQSLISYINNRKAHLRPWNALVANCVTFGRDVAEYLGVKMPLSFRLSPSVVLYPKNVVEAIRDANGIYKDQGPLKDAPGSLPPEVAAQLAERPPTAAATPRHVASKKWAKRLAGPQSDQTTAASAATP
jgi:hypothetical protein